MEGPPRDPVKAGPGSPWTIAGSARATTSPSTNCPAQAVWLSCERCGPGGAKPLILVTPGAVVNWHRAGFRLYWTWVSRVGQVGGGSVPAKRSAPFIPVWFPESELGSTAQLRRTAQAGFRALGKEVSRWIRRAPRDPIP